MRFVMALLLVLLPLPALAQDGAALCEWAARQAAAESGVPADILGALTLTETGRQQGGLTRPWAWSVNAEGKGSWFDDPALALSFAEDRVAQGRTNLDVGCFQLNYRWHGEKFETLAQMFDPLTNARYAAQFVRELFAETGDWRRAAGAFHSRTPQHAARYLARFDELRAGLDPSGVNGQRNGVETYNRFAEVTPGELAQIPQPARQVRIVDNRMLLGAPKGTQVTGMPGSLAAIGAARSALLGAGSQPLPAPRTALLAGGNGPLFGPDAAPRRERVRRGRGSGSAEAIVPLSPEAEAAEMSAHPPELAEYPAELPDGGAPPMDLVLDGADEVL